MGLTLTPKSLAFVEGQTKSIRATVTPSNSTDEVVWLNHFLFENKGGGLALSARVVTYENKYPGIEIEALKDNDSKLVKVKIGNVEKNIFVYVKK